MDPQNQYQSGQQPQASEPAPQYQPVQPAQQQVPNQPPQQPQQQYAQQQAQYQPQQQMPPQQQQSPQAGAPSGTSNAGMAIISYLGILILIPFLTDAKNDPFVKFHMKQGLALIISFIAQFVIVVIPILGWLIGFVLMIFNVVMVIMGIINAATGKQKPLPILGSIAAKFNF